MSENDLNLLNISENTKNELTTLDVPKSELILDKNVITELEKVINNEFFEGRQTKTPIRYLKVVKIHCLRLILLSLFCFRYEITYWTSG